MYYLCKLSDRLWNPCLLILFLMVGGWYTLRSGFFQLRVFTWMRHTVGALKKTARQPGHGLTQLQALATALASTIGTGSIAGVATAIFLGGPGAVLWMWGSAALGMMTGFAEKTLAVRYRERLPGGFQGGPMRYMEFGLCKLGRPMAATFCLACVMASLAGGAMVQSNSISAALNAAFGLKPLPVGLCVAALVGWVIFGGIGRVGRLSERLVPAMAGLFLLGGGLCLFVHRAALPAAFSAIWQGAFHPRAAFGGYSAGLALRYGVARGVFTNEAGLGSSAIAHAAAQTDSPIREGMWGMFEVFVSTGLVCTVTALVILTSGVYDPAAAWAAIKSGQVTDAMLGAPLSARAFSATLGSLGAPLVAVCLLLFAFTSLLGWSYYGERSLAWLCGSTHGTGAFRAVFLGCVVLGAVGSVEGVWQLADLFNGLMALPNLAALLLLSPEVLRLLPPSLAFSDGSLYDIG